MELCEEDYLVGIWFAEKHGKYNWQCTIKKAVVGWVGEYRHRYIVDDAVFTSNDRKSFYEFTIPESETEEQVIAKGNFLMAAIVKLQGCEFAEFVEVRGGMHKFMFKLAQTTWAQVKTVSKEEALKGGYLPKEEGNG